MELDKKLWSLDSGRLVIFNLKKNKDEKKFYYYIITNK